ncbi:MAG TPA: hypothetical protein VIN59_08205 [Alphaproteobacteria bacterium]
MDYRPKSGSSLKRRAKAWALVAGISAGAVVTAEIASRVALNARTWGLTDFAHGPYVPEPEFCDSISASALNAHFSGSELSLIAGLYAGALKDNAPDRARAIEAAVQASLLTGVDINFILIKMQRESSLGILRNASTSSAKGNLQATGPTWIELLYNQVLFKNDDQYMPIYGPYLRKLKVWLEKGMFKYSTDAETEKYLLGLRLMDPQLETYVFAKQWAHDYPELVRSNHQDLLVSARLGGEMINGGLKGIASSMPIWMRLVFDGDFKIQAQSYREHFLGDRGDARLQSHLWQPGAASEAFPSQAAANPNVFYKTNGTPRTASEVYDFLNEGAVKAVQDVQMLSYGGNNLASTCEQARVEVKLPRPRPNLS